MAKHKAATAAMKKAAAAASALRAEERGAAQAAAGLAIHASLADARETALAEAASFREQAQAEEATARKQRAAMEKAWEIMQLEDEKMVPLRPASPPAGIPGAPLMPRGARLSARRRSAKTGKRRGS